MSLILSRKFREEIMIGDDIKITVLEGERKGQVRLRFDAPEEVGIWRKEIWDRMQDERKESDL